MADSETIATALDAWVRLGTSAAASESTGIPHSTLRTWKDRNRALWDRLKQVHAREVQERHAASVKRAWADLDEAARIAMGKIRAELYADGREFFALTKVVSEYARHGDTVARLDAGIPTAITEERLSDADLVASIARLATEHGVAIDLPKIDGAISHTLQRH